MVILYPSLTNVIFVNKAHPQTTEKIRLNPYIGNQFIINTSWSLIISFKRSELRVN